MRRPPAPGSDGPEQRSLEDKQPEAFAENPTLSASSEQSPLCSGLFLSATEKQAIRPRPCSSSFAKSPARRACTVASARRAARRRYQLFASCERPPPASPKRFHSPPPRRSKVRFAPACFCLRQKNKPSARSLAPPLSQKVPLGAPVRLQAPARRRAVATNFLRATRGRRPPPPNVRDLYASAFALPAPSRLPAMAARTAGFAFRCDIWYHIMQIHRLQPCGRAGGEAFCRTYTSSGIRWLATVRRAGFLRMCAACLNAPGPIFPTR